MRSENVAPAVDCDDAMVKAACLIDDSSCPAACKTTDEPTEPTVVKAGDLAVSATPAAGRKILIGGISDLDTLTFKSSEEVTLTKVILERYGYSQNTDVVDVWLEDEDGNKIADEKKLDAKGQAKLTIKKDYRTVDGNYAATIVVRANGTGGNTMGFKVVDVESTAKNLNVSNYKPYTYDMVAYSGATVTLSSRPSAKDYNYEAGKSYEVAKFKVKAPADSAVRVFGFSLVNEYATTGDRVDVERFLDNVTLTVDGKTVKAKYSVDRDAKVSISFDEIEIAAKQSVEFVVSESFTDDFDQYNKYIEYVVNSGDFNAIDSKTESRVQLNVSKLPMSAYHFLGGKVKLANTKVGNVDAAYGSVDVKVAEGTITTSEALRGTFTLYAKNSVLTGTVGFTPVAAIETMKVSIAGEEYEASAPKLISTAGGSYNYQTGDIVVGSDGNVYTAIASGANWNFTKLKGIPGVPYTFSNVDIEKSGKVVVKVDLSEESKFEGRKITFDTFNSSSFESLSYEDTRGLDAAGNVNGFVNLYQLTVKPGKAALKNNLTTSKAVEFILKETNAKVVFDGTYTAKNGNVSLTDWTINGTNPSTSGKVTFYLSIDGEEVDDVVINANTVTRQLSNVKINEGEEVKVLITAEIEGYKTGSLNNYQIIFNGEDDNNNPSGQASARTANISIVEKASVTVSNDAVKNTALRKAAQQSIATFRVKPSNGASDVDLDSIAFEIVGEAGAFADFTEYDVTVSIAGTEENIDVTIGSDKLVVSASPFITLDTAGVDVNVVLEKEVIGNVQLSGLLLNGIDQKKTFSKYFVESLVSFESIVDENSAYTEYKLKVDGDAANSISGFVVYLSKDNCVDAFSGAAAATATGAITTVTDGDTIILKRTNDVLEVCGVEYEVWDTTKIQTVSIAKTVYGDYFKIGGKAMVIPAKK